MANGQKSDLTIHDLQEICTNATLRLIQVVEEPKVTAQGTNLPPVMVPVRIIVRNAAGRERTIQIEDGTTKDSIADAVVAAFTARKAPSTTESAAQ